MRLAERQDQQLVAYSFIQALIGVSDLKQAAPYRNGYRVRPIIGP